MAEFPQTMGPYRILGRLGKGGMGEIFLAEDPRLNRKVAIKKLRLERIGSNHHRQRLKREASLAANLNHPTIVHIHDIIPYEDGEAIVMEYVPGISLRQHLRKGPLSVEECVRIGSQIAEGLFHAHERGVIHRDLKLDNILLDEHQCIKITDFGIAKSISGDSSDGLTHDGALVGTVYAMSPEQARGKNLDYRSDLFSLGTLLYHLLTGVSPFKAENRLATLDRIVHQPHRPLSERVENPPQPLIAIVDQLLQKRADLRPRSAREVAEALLALSAEPVSEPLTLAGDSTEVPALETPALVMATTPAQKRRWPWLLVPLAMALLGWFWWPPTTPPERLDVAVMVEPGLTESARDIAFQAELAVSASLANLAGIAPIDSAELTRLQGSPSQVARALAAREIWFVAARCEDDDCQLSLRRLQGLDGSVLWAGQLPVGGSERTMAQAIRAQVRQAYPGRKPMQVEPLASTQADLYGRYLELRRDHEKELRPRVELLAAARELRLAASEFPEAYLLEIWLCRELFLETREEGYLDQAFATLEQLPDQLGHMAPIGFAEVDLALVGGRLDFAQSRLDQLEQSFSRSPATFSLMARLAEKRGEFTSAIQWARQAADQRPSTTNLFNLGRLLFRQGQTDEARGVLGEVLERNPSFLRGKRMLAQMELAHGSLVEAARLLGELAEVDPSIGNLSNYGVTLMLAGKLNRARTQFERALQQAPKHVTVLLNLADTLDLMGDNGQARHHYEKVLLHLDGEANPRGYAGIRAQALAQLGKDVEAVDAIQEAVKQAPSDAFTLYQAALVYVLVGDQTSALSFSRKAAEAGMDPRWFKLAWFQSIRDVPDFAAILTQ